MRRALAVVVVLAACGDDAEPDVLSGPHPMGEYVAEFADLQEEWESRCDIDIPSEQGWAASLCRDRGYGAEWNLDCAAVVDIDFRGCHEEMRGLTCGPFPMAIPTSCAELFVVGF